MSLSSRIKLLLLLWFAGEVLAFVMIAHLVGVADAVLLAFLTSLLGWTLLKRVGAAAMIKFRAAFEGRLVADGQTRPVLDDTLASVGAVALLMPGFLSDAIGLLLAVPAARGRISRWIARGRLSNFLRPKGQGTRAGPATIDLDPADWERSDGSRKPVSKY